MILNIFHFYIFMRVSYKGLNPPFCNCARELLPIECSFRKQRWDCLCKGYSWRGEHAVFLKLRVKGSCFLIVSPLQYTRLLAYKSCQERNCASKLVIFLSSKACYFPSSRPFVLPFIFLCKVLWVFKLTFSICSNVLYVSFLLIMQFSFSTIQEMKRSLIHVSVELYKLIACDTGELDLMNQIDPHNSLCVLACSPQRHIDCLHA